MLPLWIQWPQAILLLVLSCLGAWIAYKQVRIATAKLNLDLFDRRFKVFEATRDLLGHIMREGKADVGSIRVFNVGVADAVFLFEEDVTAYLKHLRERAVSLHTKTVQLAALRDESEHRGKLIDQIYVLETRFADEYENMIEVFQPYLKLGNI
jgi:hypothetical protein